MWETIQLQLRHLCHQQSSGSYITCIQWQLRHLHHRQFNGSYCDDPLSVIKYIYNIYIYTKYIRLQRLAPHWRNSQHSVCWHHGGTIKGSPLNPPIPYCCDGSRGFKGASNEAQLCRDM